jgi:uncharacterized membrane protein
VNPAHTLSVSVLVRAPIWRVYQNWRRLERFPTFVPSVREARWLTKDRLYWREAYLGEEYESTFAITMLENENSLQWQSLTGPESSGTAKCEARPFGHTCINLTVNYAPDAPLQQTTAVRRRHHEFLESFKRFVESKLLRERPAPMPESSSPQEVKS